MVFIINFNLEKDDACLEALAARKRVRDGFTEYVIDIDSFEELEELESLVFDLKDDYYSLVVSFDPPTIYLDNKV